jgi:hypothetical protein
MSRYPAKMLPVLLSKSNTLLLLKEKSESKISILPVDAERDPTGTDPLPRSDSVLVIEKDETDSLMFTVSLGDISIKSRVQLFLFIVSTTILIPRIHSNSLN